MEVKSILDVRASDYMRNIDEQVADDAKRAANSKIAANESQQERVKGSSSLQKELLSLLSSNLENKAQKEVRDQLDQGYLDIKV